MKAGGRTRLFDTEQPIRITWLICALDAGAVVLCPDFYTSTDGNYLMEICESGWISCWASPPHLLALTGRSWNRERVCQG